MQNIEQNNEQDTEFLEENSEDFRVASEQWWLARPEHLLVWARLQVMESGIAIIFDSKGEWLTYESEDIARGALMDADFRSLDGMDEDDAESLELDLEELEPPQGEDESDLLPQMIKTIGPQLS